MDTRGFLVKRAQETKTILCFGVDPDNLKIAPVMGEGTTMDMAIPQFFHPIIEKLLDENAISAIKPNYAYFAQYGFAGFYALEDIMQHYRNKVPVILDAKRGDIGKSSEAYAKEVYDFWGADAVTISPYMGYDSVAPFLKEDKLAYMLCKTSNTGSEDFQELKLKSGAIYEKVARKAVEWKTGIVVGATDTSIKKIMKITKGHVPMLIPGIGTQGGDLGMVLKAIKDNAAIHRINASSSISYAYQKSKDRPQDAALVEAQKLNSEMRKYL